MVRREPPQTEEGWYALHDLRTIDWAAWRDAPERVRERALAEAVDYLEAHAAVADAPEGDSAVFSVLGHKADLLVLHLRPTTAHLDAAERRFEQTEFAQFTEQSYSYVSVTEASGYTERAREYFEGEVDEDSGLAQYIRERLHPDIPDHEHVCFYPMSKRRDPDYNWYDLPFEERAEHMASHGDIGRDYAGKVQQMITGSVGFDDWEWGVTLWADDMVDVKDLLYEMRFHPSSSKYAEFGPFYVGRRFPPEDLEAVLAGEAVPTDGDAAADVAPLSGEPGAGARGNGHARASREGDDAAVGDGGHRDEQEASGDDEESAGPPPGVAGDESGGGRPAAATADTDVPAVEDLPERLRRFGVTPDEYGDGDYGLLFHSGADAETLEAEVSGLRENFDHYDTHVRTVVRAEGGQTAVVSVWRTESAADTAAGFLADLPEVSDGARGPLGEGDGDESGDAAGEADAASIREELADMDVYAGKPHGEDVYAVVLYSEADPADLAAEVDDLRDGFDRYDTHVRTAVYEDEGGDVSAVVSLWDTEGAVEKATDFLTDLPGIVGRPDEGDGFGTMGMFYTVKPDYREEFVETFADVGDMLAEMDGHRETSLLVNREDENDMFIASQWDAKEDAMAFFRSDDFRETVEWGREVLDDRPRHVFLA